MDIYLTPLQNKKSSFRFPSMPDDGIDVKKQTKYQKYSIIDRGDLDFAAGMESQPIKWKGYFWGKSRKNQSSINREWKSPEKCIKKLSKWQQAGTPLNLIVSGAGINIDVTIQSFNYKPFGGHGDYSYDISFLPYQELRIYTTKELGVEKKAKKKKKTKTRNSKKSDNSKKTYTVVSGDTLCGIARKMYKSEGKWTSIYDANKSAIESAAKKHGYSGSDHGHWIFPGTVLSIP